MLTRAWRPGGVEKALAHIFPAPEPDSSPRTLDRDQLDERVAPEQYAPTWGMRGEREGEFFQGCGPASITAPRGTARGARSTSGC